MADFDDTNMLLLLIWIEYQHVFPPDLPHFVRMGPYDSLETF